MLTALSLIASNQAEPTKETMSYIKFFLDYAASNQDAIITYHASDMVLVVQSNASYLSKPKARSRVGGHFFMSSDIANPADNGAVLNIAQLIKAVMSLAAEAELGALYISACEAVPIHYSLQKWDISNHQRQPKPTTARHLEWSTATSNLGEQKPWICGFTGYFAVKPNDNSGSTGTLAKPTWAITGPNIIVPHTTSRNAAPS
jgi:hypothetical protein